MIMFTYIFSPKKRKTLSKEQLDKENKIWREKRRIELENDMMELVLMKLSNANLWMDGYVAPYSILELTKKNEVHICQLLMRIKS